MKARVFYIECVLNPDGKTYSREAKQVEYEGEDVPSARERCKREVNVERKGFERDGNPFYEKYAEIWGVREVTGDGQLANQ